MNPDYLVYFLARFEPKSLNLTLPLTLQQLEALQKAARKIRTRLHLCRLITSQRSAIATFVPKNLRQVAALYVELFHRRPDIAKAMGISEQQVQQFIKQEVSVSSITELATELSGLCSDGSMILTAALASANRQVAATADKMQNDPALDLAVRRGIRFAFRSVTVTEMAQAQKMTSAQQGDQKAKQDRAKQQQTATLPLSRQQAIAELLAGDSQITAPQTLAAKKSRTHKPATKGKTGKKSGTKTGTTTKKKTKKKAKPATSLK
jgi:hypothetical protein